MIINVQVFQEVHEKWPARNGKPGGEAFGLLVLDNTMPAKHALRDMYQYRLSEEERAKYWGKVERKTLTLAVTSIVQGGTNKPVLRGEVLEVK